MECNIKELERRLDKWKTVIITLKRVKDNLQKEILKANRIVLNGIKELKQLQLRMKTGERK